MRKHKITINIDMSLLSRDVQDKASRLMKIIRSSKNGAVTSDITEDADLISRAISYAVSEIMSMCKEYIWSNQHTTSNKMLNNGNIKMILIMPLSFNLAGCTPLGQMIHAYIVARALSEWLRYTSPELMEPQMSICLDTSRSITNILNDRVPRYRVGQDIELIVGDADITMLYKFEHELFENIPETFSTTTDREFTREVGSGDQQTVAVGLPMGKVPTIGDKPIRQLGKAVYQDQVYVWWTTDAFEPGSTIKITYN